MKDSLVYKSTFFFMLLFGGFCLEKYFHHRAAHLKEIDLNKNKKQRILLLGGSIVSNVQDGLEYVLKEKGINEDFELLTMAYPILRSKDAKNLILKNVENIKPDFVFLLLGMDEALPSNSGFVLDSMALEHINLAIKKDKKKLSELFAATLEKIIWRTESNKNQDMYHFFFLGNRMVTEHIDLEIVFPKVRKLIEIEASKQKPDLYKVMRTIFLLNFIRDHSEAIFTKEDAGTKTSSWEKRSFLIDFEGFIIHGLKEINQFGCPIYVSKKSLYHEIDRRWLCLLTIRAGTDEQKVFDFIFQNPFVIMPYSILVLRDRGLSKVKYQMQLTKTLTGLKNTKLKRFNSEEFQGTGKEIIVNLKEIKTLLDNKNVGVILLHYPKTERMLITQIGKDLGIKTVEGKSAFENVVNQENYYQYFLDILEDTGHMTYLGSILYGRSLVQQLPEIFESNNK